MANVKHRAIIAEMNATIETMRAQYTDLLLSHQRVEAELLEMDDQLMEAEQAHGNAARWFAEQKKQYARAENLGAERNALRDDAQALVAKLHHVHDSAAYQGVWTLYQSHSGMYEGPQYTNELAALESRLQPREGGEMCRCVVEPFA